MNSRGIEKLTPTEEKLKQMDMHPKRWQRIWYTGAELKIKEAIAICEFVNCQMNELVTD